MGRPKKTDALEKTIPLRMTKALLREVKEAAKITGKSELEVIREAIAIGLEDWRRIDFKTAVAIVDKAEEPTQIAPFLKIPHHASSMVAEEVDPRRN